MCAFEKDYARISGLILEERMYMDRSIDFSRLCSMAGAEKTDMDALMTAELGVDGDTYLLIMRELERKKLLSEYGINTF